MCFRCVRGQHVFGEELAGKRFRLEGNRLRVGGYFTGHIARRKFPILDRKNRLSIGSIENKDETMLRRLHDGVDRLTVLTQCDQAGWRR